MITNTIKMTLVFLRKRPFWILRGKKEKVSTLSALIWGRNKVLPQRGAKVDSQTRSLTLIKLNLKQIYPFVYTIAD